MLAQLVVQNVIGAVVVVVLVCLGCLQGLIMCTWHCTVEVKAKAKEGWWSASNADSQCVRRQNSCCCGMSTAAAAEDWAADEGRDDDSAGLSLPFVEHVALSD